MLKRFPFRRFQIDSAARNSRFAAGRRVPGAAQCGAKGTVRRRRDHSAPWRSRISGAPLRFASRCTASGTGPTWCPCAFAGTKEPGWARPPCRLVVRYETDMV